MPAVAIEVVHSPLQESYHGGERPEAEAVDPGLQAGLGGRDPLRAGLGVEGHLFPAPAQGRLRPERGGHVRVHARAPRGGKGILGALPDEIVAEQVIHAAVAFHHPHQPLALQAFQCGKQGVHGHIQQRFQQGGRQAPAQQGRPLQHHAAILAGHADAFIEDGVQGGARSGGLAVHGQGERGQGMAGAAGENIGGIAP